ncbi:hypothetical protein [Lactovum miscens]|uniref:Uncharacterized protein n=1 Tax=Lactovum miscens TaxID=190387 RepID=A0A841C198_9LACT|nr:hypothetical protein [Lactovum miscens]MBB5887686.1 hypothetical protein [Lactovum miscens]
MNNENEVRAIDTIVLKNNIGEELNLVRTHPQKLETGHFQELLADGTLAETTLFGMTQLKQTVEVSAQGLNLFTQAVPIGQLKTYADGTISSMVKGQAGQIAAHNGFVQAGALSATISNPIVPIVLLTTLVIKQQFNELNKKIDKITDKLDSITGMMHAEKLAILQTIDARIKAITQQENISSENLNELSILANDAQTVFHQYKILLDQFDTTTLLKYKGVNDEARIAYMLDNIKNSDFINAFKLAYYADSLSWLVRLTIITSLVKAGTQSNIINERVVSFKNEFQNSFSSSASLYIDKVRKPVIEKALGMITKVDTVEDIAAGALGKIANVANRLPLRAAKKMQLHSEKLKSETDDKKVKIAMALDEEFEKITRPVLGVNVEDLATNIINNLTSPREIVYAMDDKSDKVRIFIGETVTD